MSRCNYGKAVFTDQGRLVASTQNNGFIGTGFMFVLKTATASAACALSPRCGRTLSVLPKNRLPYIALNTAIVESEFDARASGTDPPSRSEKERGCLRRAFERFAARVTPLCALLGQMIGPIKPSVGECWRGLRQLDNLEGILLLLGTKFNTSLLGDYRCLQPGF